MWAPFKVHNQPGMLMLPVEVDRDVARPYSPSQDTNSASGIGEIRSSVGICVGRFSITVIKCKRRKGLFQLAVSEVSVHDHFNLPLWAFDRQKSMTRSVAWS